MSSRILLYKGACRHLGEPPIEALTDNVQVRHELDGVWDNNGVRRCLNSGQWNFATRSARLEFEPSITPEFGYPYAFEKPSDFVRTTGVCSDEFFKCPLLDYLDERNYWWANLDQIYVRFVSSDNLYGGDLGEWPEEFAEFAEAWFALQVTKVATYADRHDAMEETTKRLLLTAQSRDAMATPAKRPPLGTWATSRLTSGSGDRGSRSRLTG